MENKKEIIMIYKFNGKYYIDILILCDMTNEEKEEIINVCKTGVNDYGSSLVYDIEWIWRYSNLAMILRTEDPIPEFYPIKFIEREEIPKYEILILEYNKEINKFYKKIKSLKNKIEKGEATIL